MSSHRATKSGLAWESQQKVKEKFDVELAREGLEWIRDNIEEEFNTDGEYHNFHEQLKDGVKLCKLMNALEPGRVRKINTTGMAFKLMENINSFTLAARAFGVSDNETFQTVDLWEAQNLHQVVVCLHALGRKAQSKGLRGLGPREAEKNVRDFSDDVLKAGQSVIGLQMGTNKGANQSGINFGNTRHM